MRLRRDSCVQALFARMIIPSALPCIFSAAVFSGAVRSAASIAVKGPYDIIHFNLGLHGWQKGRIPEGQFEALTRQMVQAFRQHAPKATLSGRARPR